MSVSVAGRQDDAWQKPGGRRARNLRRAAALLASILFHATIFALLFGSLKGGQVTGGSSAGETDGEPNAITISLAGLRGAPNRTTASPADDMQALFAKIRDEQTTIATSDSPKSSRGNVAKLFGVVEPESKVVDSADGGAGRGTSDQGGHGATASHVFDAEIDKSATGHGRQQVRGPGPDVSSGRLWIQVKPCWSQLPGSSTVPVTLEIVLNDQGRLAVPPKIMRDSTDKPDQARLVAEARALAAATSCVPYSPPALAGSSKSFRVTFETSKSRPAGGW